MNTDYDVIGELTREMMRWVNGERSHTNMYQSFGLDVVAVMDAQEVVKLSAAIQTFVALEQLKIGGKK